jgi:hypothetical protein
MRSVRSPGGVRSCTSGSTSLRAAAFADPDAGARLARLEAEERDLSRGRRELHARIGELKPRPPNTVSATAAHIAAARQFHYGV